MKIILILLIIFRISGAAAYNYAEVNLGKNIIDNIQNQFDGRVLSSAPFSCNGDTCFEVRILKYNNDIIIIEIDKDGQILSIKQ